ncbi:MAG: thioredoxin family protein [Betaproteobacteria bacterium]
MTKILGSILISLAFASGQAAAAPAVGQPAPDFTLSDVSGKPVKLSDQKGKFVVLEWVNPECPYVQKHYNSANMPNLQKEFGAKSVTWLAINSTRQGHSEFKSPEEMTAWMKKTGGAPAATLLDRDSKVGKLYGAVTTPHMYVIDPKGTLVYVGAIDDKRSTRESDVKTAKNFVRVALGEAMAGKPVSTANTSPYGCSIKY